MAAEDRHDRLRIAASYAQALYDLAVEKGRLDSVRSQVESVQSALAANPVLTQFFESPTVDARRRQRLVDQLAEQLDPLIVGMLTVMNRRNRLGVLGELAEAFAAEDDRRLGRVPTQVTTATAIDADQLAEIRRVVGKHIGAEPVIEHRVDPSILGGFVAQAGDTLIDSSVTTQLATAKEQFIVRGEDEIQSG